MRKKSVTLYCFTPPVSLATFVIEFLFAAWTWWKYRSTFFGRLSVLFLLLLGYFQLAEFGICTTTYQSFWAVSSFIAIAFLPPIGLHLISMIVPGKRWVFISGYGIAALFSALFLLMPMAVSGGECPGYFVVFHTSHFYTYPYAVYYWGYITLSVLILARAFKYGKGDRSLVGWSLTAYLLNIIPLVLTHVIFPFTRLGHASVYCGYAIFLAIIFVLRILPRYYDVFFHNTIKG